MSVTRAGVGGFRLRVRLCGLRGFRLLHFFLGIGVSRTTSLRRLVLAQTLERGVAHVALRREARERDFGDELRLDPDALAAALLLRDLAERRLVAAQRLELLPQVARGLHRVAGAGAAGILQLAVLVIAEHQRADRALQVRGVLVADDDEFLVLPALRLDPVFVAARAIRRVAPLRDRCLRD